MKRIPRDTIQPELSVPSNQGPQALLFWWLSDAVLTQVYDQLDGATSEPHS